MATAFYEGMDPPMEVEVFDHVEIIESGWWWDERGKSEYREHGTPGIVTRIINRNKVAVRYKDNRNVCKRTGKPLMRTLHAHVKDLQLIARDG